MEYNFKGTPAPWFPIEYAGFWQIQDEDAYHSRDVLNYDDAINAAMELKGVSEEEAEANAHLMAAAPDLVTALITVYRTAKACGLLETLGEEEHEYMKQAIHKALNIQS